MPKVPKTSIDNILNSKSEGLIIQGCAGSATHWVDFMNAIFIEEGILLDDTIFHYCDCTQFFDRGIRCILFEFKEGIKIDIYKLAMWRIATHSSFYGKWLSDYIMNYQTRLI